MSQETAVTDPVEDDALVEEQPVAVDSLEARMERHQVQREKRTTEIFDVPGWIGILAVELRYLGLKSRHNIERRHERVRDEVQQSVRAGADKILTATVALYEVHGETRNVLEGESWQRLARAHLKEKLAPDATQRQALIALLGEDEIIDLCVEWQDWLAGKREPLAEELIQDFPETP